MQRPRNILEEYKCYATILLAGLLLFLPTCQRFEPEQLIIIKTGAVREVTHEGCQVDGEIFDAGKDGISQHGFSWSVAKNPSIETGEKNQLGPRSSTGSFFAELEDLNPSTTYYIRAYATSKDKTVYGEEHTFVTTALTTPAVHTLNVSAITLESAESGGEVISDGGSPVTVRGVCWSTSENPGLDDAFTEDGNGLGSFSSSITRLSCATVYYVRAYATNSQGTAYGPQLEFTTGACPEGLPEVSTSQITSIGETGAEGGGEVIDEGSSSVTVRGVCWSTEENPLITDDHSTNGGGAGSFVSSITGLSCGTIYYVRAYATNNAGTAYGLQEEFSTTACPVSLPTVTTSEVTQITQTSAQGGGTVTEDGGAMVSKKGLCWSTGEHPDLMDNYSEEGSGTGSFISSMTGLSCGTTYFVRAYATNSEGTAYGDQIEFRTANCPVDPPTVTTAAITNITQTSAQGGGEVTSNGGAPVSAKGICWGTIQNPSLTGVHTEDGDGTGSFTSVMTGLECGITYYVRAYATNTGGTSYGAQETFTTALCTSLPAVTTAEITNVTDLTAMGGGEVTEDGNLPITARGVCWSTSTGPEITDSKTVDGEGVGTFTSQIEGLSPGTEYFLRAYATNSEGTAYGEERVFATWEGSLIDYDGNVYPIVTIGEQAWMQQNLKATHYSDGTPIQKIENSSEMEGLSLDSKAYFYYDFIDSNGDAFGPLYTFAAAANGTTGSETNPSGIQGVCPSGWHLPSDLEWIELEMYLGMDASEVYQYGWRGTDQGSKLRAVGDAFWIGNNTNATNESGFTALPGGHLNSTYSEFVSIGEEGTYWSATNEGNQSAVGRFIGTFSEGVQRTPDEYTFGFSVRCVMDD